jgi:MFS family permease
MSYYQLFVHHRKVLTFGVTLTLFSSFGQTFLISLFVPHLLGEFSLNKAEFGTLYSAATLAGALCLPFLGRLIDRADVRAYSMAVGAGLVASCLAVSLSQGVWLLFAGIFGLRLTGQGLLSHTASTAVARSFTSLRGKALGVSGLGYPLGEGVLPLTVALLIGVCGWRLSWGVIGAFVALTLLPLTWRMSKVSPAPSGAEARETRPNAEEPPGTTALPCDRSGAGESYWKDSRFYFATPGMLVLPFVLTGLFLYQAPLAESKGWSAALMASGFLAFAAARVLSSLAVGPLIDRSGAARLFPFHMLPAVLGLLCLLLFSTPLAAVLYLLLAGVSQGLEGSIKTAMWAELYGPGRLGAVRSMSSSLSVVATALSPLVFGWLLDAGAGFDGVLGVSLLLVVAASAAGLFARPKGAGPTRGAAFLPPLSDGAARGEA